MPGMGLLLEWSEPPAPEVQAEEFPELPADLDAWRWEDLLADEALKLDMTDGGFNWTPGELEEARLIGSYARRSSLYLDQDNIQMIEKELKLCRS